MLINEAPIRIPATNAGPTALPIELEGLAGRLLLEPNGQLRFKHNGRIVLQSAASPVFSWTPTTEVEAKGIARVEFHGNCLTVHYKTTQPDLYLTLDVEPTGVGFCLRWGSSSKLSAIGTRWELSPHGPWYGQGARYLQTWPLDRQTVTAERLMPYDCARDGTLLQVTPLWFNAAGAALLAQDGGGEFEATLRHADDELLRLIAHAPQPETVATFGGVPEPLGAELILDLLLAENLPATFDLALKTLGHPTTAPPAELFTRPIWTTWAYYKAAINQPAVLEFAEAIVSHDYPRSVMEIDDRWQIHYGTYEWDQEKFPDPRAMIARLHELGFKVTLWTPTFFEPGTPGFAEAAQHSYLVRQPRSDAPYLVRWWNGEGGLMDVSNPEALDWWLSKLRGLQTEFGVDGFKFDAGEGNYLPQDARTAYPLPSREYPDRYAAWVNQHFHWAEVRSGWRAQRNGLLFRQWDKSSRWGRDNGLHSVLTQALTMSVIGYPFILPDMIGGNAYDGEVPDGELVARWTQLTALLPSMQFGLPPWNYGDSINTICQQYARLHTELAPYLLSLTAQTLRRGTPLVRPLFWHTPEDQTAQMIDDQFLVGEKLLAAPVLQAAQRTRDIYLPAGHWRDYWSGAVYKGPRWLKDYPAPLETLPLFEKLG